MLSIPLVETSFGHFDRHQDNAIQNLKKKLVTLFWGRGPTALSGPGPPHSRCF